MPPNLILTGVERELRADDVRHLIVNDAIDTATVVRELTYLRARRTALYRPLIGRQLVSEDNSVPEWAETVVVQQVKGHGQRARPMGNPGTGERGVVPTRSKTEISFKQWTFVTGYEVLDAELARAAVTGVNVRDVDVETNVRLYSEHVDQIVCVGDSLYSIPGLCNRTDVVGDNSLTYIDACDKVDTGTASYLWAVPANATEAKLMAMVYGMVKDVGALIAKVRTNSKQLYELDTIALPLSWWTAAGQTIQPMLGKTAQQVLRETYPQVRRWVPWYRLETAGHDAGTRMVGFDSTSPQVARLCISRDLYDDQAQRLAQGFGIYVPQAYTLAGILCEQPSGIAYLDGTPHA